MSWIFLSLIYAVFNAFYTTFNEHRHYNGYVLGIWRGFGVSLLVAPLQLSVPQIDSAPYYAILILQGLMIGVYDSHIFFASAQYGSHSCSGFMATCVLITTFMWWGIDFSELAELLQTPPLIVSIFLCLCGFSAGYWQMMKVKISRQAEEYLYPAVFALALMSIATRFIAIHGGSAYTGVIYYLTVACFTSGVYNTVMFLSTNTSPINQAKERAEADKTPKLTRFQQLKAPLASGHAFWLIIFSTILIASKTLALREAANPGYVIAMLLLSPMIADMIKTKRFPTTPATFVVIFFLSLLLFLVN